MFLRGGNNLDVFYCILPYRRDGRCGQLIIGHFS